MRRADRSKTFASLEQMLHHSPYPALREAVNRYRALTPLNTAWRRSVPEPLCRHTHPVALDRGILNVHAESPVWANLLRNTEHSLVSALQDSGLSGVRSIRVRIAPPQPSDAALPTKGHDEADPRITRLLAQLRKALD